MSRPPVLRSLQTIVSGTVLVQEQVRAVLAQQRDRGRLAQRIVTTSFNVSGIDRRHTVIDELSLDSDVADPLFFDRRSGMLLAPGTKARNDIYTREATRLFIDVARRALDADPEIG